MAKISTTVMPTKPNMAYRMGNALRGLGEMAQEMGEFTQKTGYAKELKDMIEGHLNKFNETDLKKLQETAPEQDVATIGVSQDTANPIAKMSKGMTPLKPATNQLRATTPQVSAPAHGMVNAQPQMPSLAPQAPQGQNALSPEDPQQAQNKKLYMEGMVELINKGVPQKELQEAMMQAQLINLESSRLAAKWGYPDAANEYLSRFLQNKLDYYKQRYGAESEKLNQILNYTISQNTEKNKALQKRLDRESAERIAQIRSKGQGGSVGQNAVDKAFSKDYVQWIYGRANIEKDLNNMKSAVETLKTNPNISGWLVGPLPDFIKAAFTPEALQTRDRIHNTINQTLRQILGAQFTQKEGERLLNMAFNPLLREEENYDRAIRLYESLIQQARYKQEAVDYWEKNGGTLNGFDTSKIITGDSTAEDYVKIHDLNFNDKQPNSQQPGANIQVAPEVEEYAKRYNLSKDEAFKILENRKKGGLSGVTE